ncbi:hypothetical protein IVA94_14770 [Bradyrhizobium sp. 156]|uniref:hypothetical protein n=1 Tax=Bradyrhizobium sp. 156 TaxID=2782630 RepID=UPI001FF8499F|nr:hypothetical protein [Bradyrhizobium sp. 156]MCK1322132.1 hypothetical protein [Bradyrhizobium sp. 156]
MTKIEFVGGPAHGATMERPRTSTVNVPVPDTMGIGQASYTMRRCRSEAGDIVEVLAVAGRPIDAAWLARRGLRN